MTTAGIRVEKAHGTASLSFAPGDSEIAWESTLAESATIHLRADPTTASRWSESWLVQVGATWHATFTGIPPVRRAQVSTERVPEWRPWPGEQVDIALGKPSGVAGQTLTIDASTLTVAPGTRSSQVTLLLELRSSRGTQHKIALSPGASVESVSLDSSSQVVRQEGQELVLTVPPGKHSFRIDWRQTAGLSLLFRAPAVDLRLPSANANVVFELGGAPRWLVWLNGPRLGPSVHFWFMAMLVLLFAWALARSRLTPLRIHHLMLLGLGLLQMNTVHALVVPACLLVLGWRARTERTTRGWLHDAGQIVLFVLVLASLAVLYGAVERSLLRPPDMQIPGDDSRPASLAWYQNRGNPILPQPWMLSLPLYVYRAAMLAWALWLAASAMRWSRWIWACFKQHGLWHPIAKPLAPPPGA